MTEEQTKFYLRRPNSNVLAIQPDRTPVQVTKDGIQEAIEFYDDRVPMYYLGRLVAISVDDFYREYVVPVQERKARARSSDTVPRPPL